VISIFIGASPFFVDVFVDTLIKESAFFSSFINFTQNKLHYPFFKALIGPSTFVFATGPNEVQHPLKKKLSLCAPK